MRPVLAFCAYVIPTFAIAVVWHLVVFAEVYESLAVYRPDKNIPLGLVTICLQGAVFALLYPRLGLSGGVLVRGLKLALLAGALAWSYMVLAVAAKHPMASVPGYLLIESAFTALQWLVAGPLIAAAHSLYSQPRTRSISAPGLAPPGTTR